MSIHITDIATLTVAKSATRLDTILRCEALGFEGDLLRVYELSEGSSRLGRMAHYPAIDIVSCHWSADAEDVLVVNVKRNLPLSSAHGGQPLRLCFYFMATDIFAISTPFTVFAKQGKAGQPHKPLKHKLQPMLTPDRQRALETMKEALESAKITSSACAVGLTNEEAANSPKRFH